MKNRHRHGKAAFTLIELLAVITIIVILAAIVVGGMGYVTDRQASEKARIQIALISKALEDYKLDNGVYPPSDNTADGLNQSSKLFEALYYDAAKEGSTPSGEFKIYLAELDPVNNKQGWTSGTGSPTTRILDPWGNEYRYRSAYGTATGGTASKNDNTQNPEFDLWSAGKDGRSRPAMPNSKENKDDIKNF
ncbi:type II secretion system protein GspG [Luteolibacter yonseiensis]|uniref:Type II secretion system protein GspG n=1 Tax=Luteolibacter yonseiensis TaxID=1144680 RepID=A0A934R3B0_9BACT|nr:type II secretion system protein GspG [Luteolibacter yonseiensis]MBK1816266.1 type II secretion system protein GspG [Luteolibacter yonseiensis]